MDYTSDTVNHVGFTAGVHGKPCTPCGAWQSLDSKVPTPSGLLESV